MRGDLSGAAQTARCPRVHKAGCRGKGQGGNMPAWGGRSEREKGKEGREAPAPMSAVPGSEAVMPGRSGEGGERIPFRRRGVGDALKGDAREKRKRRRPWPRLSRAIAAEGGREEEGRSRGERNSSGARRAILSFLLLAATGGLLWVYTATGVLNVREVEVRGNERLDTSYLRALSGITSDTHLLKMDVKAVERALLTEPYVEAVEVERCFPAKVLLTVRERKPVGFVRQNGRSVMVAGDGMVLESLEQAPKGLAEIKTSGIPLLVPGTKLQQEDFDIVSSLLSSMGEDLAAMVSAAGCANGVLYLEARGTRIVYGDLSELERKNSVAFLALSELMDRYGAVEYIDVSFPDRPVIKPLASEVAGADDVR